MRVHVCAARACVRCACMCALRVHVCEAPNRNFDTIRCTRRSNRAVAFLFNPSGLAFGLLQKSVFGVCDQILAKNVVTKNYLLAIPLLGTDNFHELDLGQPSKVVYLR